MVGGGVGAVPPGEAVRRYGGVESRMECGSKGEKKPEELVESIVLCLQNEGECIWTREGSRTVVAVNRNRGSASSVRGVVGL
jgi:hypothetical protein